MSRTVRIFVATGASLFFLCLLAAIGTAFSRGAWTVLADSRQAGSLASNVDSLSYVLPQGYHEQFRSHFLGFSLVGIDADSGEGHIYLAQVPPGISVQPTDWSGSAYRRHSYGAGDYAQVKPVGRMLRTIRGQAVTMTMSEGVNSEDVPYREMSGRFQGENGEVTITIAGAIAEWDDAAIDQFIASIR